MPNWQRLNPANGPDNVRRAMEIAEREFRIPMVLEPDHFARLANQKYWKIFADSTKNIFSPHLDELSGMTYLSYFMKEEDSPGYYSTLNWVKNQIPNFRINNFRVSLFLLLHLSTCLPPHSTLNCTVHTAANLGYVLCDTQYTTQHLPLTEYLPSVPAFLSIMATLLWWHHRSSPCIVSCITLYCITLYHRVPHDQCVSTLAADTQISALEGS